MMRDILPLLKWIWGPLWLLAAMLTAVPATAQPNPFDAYEGQRKAAPAPDQTLPQECPPQAAQPAAELDRLEVEQGQWILGALTTLSYTSSSNGTLAGDVDNSTLFMRLGPSVGYLVLDRVEVGMGLGMMVRRMGREGGESATGLDWSLEVYGRYHLPLEGRFSLMPNARVGVYTGSSSREVSIVTSQDEVRRINEETSTLGLIVTAALDVGYMITDHVQMRAGLGLSGVWGTERVTSQESSFWGSTYNVGLGLGVDYHF